MPTTFSVALPCDGSVVEKLSVNVPRSVCACRSRTLAEPDARLISFHENDIVASLAPVLRSTTARAPAAASGLVHSVWSPRTSTPCRAKSSWLMAMTSLLVSVALVASLM